MTNVETGVDVTTFAGLGLRPELALAAQNEPTDPARAIPPQLNRRDLPRDRHRQDGVRAAVCNG